MALRKVHVAPGIEWVEVAELQVRVLCGCPADSIKHLYRQGLIVQEFSAGVAFESGPNILLLSDYAVQNGVLANMGEFPVLQMLYRQGLMIPGHPNNTGAKPMIVGTREQLDAQLAYIYRGNYGLVSEQELCAAGLTEEEARERMQMKLHFAFGRISSPSDFLDTRLLGEERIELVKGLGLQRVAPNVFEFDHQGETVRVDLNLAIHEHYASAVHLPHRYAKRESFAVLHSGEGDGWDTERNSMSSILIHKGRCYLIDAGPAILSTLEVLGIGLQEIDGIFHTHAHDDHFAGLPALMRSDHRVRYFATPEVCASVSKKLAALTSLSETVLADYFEVVELRREEWNCVDGLQVRPVFSPHPIETTVFFFRAEHEGRSCSYAHLADISSFKVLEAMQGSDPSGAGVSRKFVERAKQAYLEPADLKKIDIGGGMIHGQAEDFLADQSVRILLSHTSAPLSDPQQNIGQRAQFGQLDVFFPADDAEHLCRVRRVLQRMFPHASADAIAPLLSNERVLLSPGSTFLHEDEHPEQVFVLLTGSVRQHRRDRAEGACLYAGSPAGERAVLLRQPQAWSLETLCHVEALRVPAEQYRAFVQAHFSERELSRDLAVLQTLAESELFREGVTYPVLRQLVRELEPMPMQCGESLHDLHAGRLMLIVEGRVALKQADNSTLWLGPGDFFGEASVLAVKLVATDLSAASDGLLYALPTKTVRDMPVCRWLLLETYRRRSRLPC